MKNVLAICLLAASPWVWAADKAAAPPAAAPAPAAAALSVSGEVLETIDVLLKQGVSPMKIVELLQSGMTEAGELFGQAQQPWQWCPTE